MRILVTGFGPFPTMPRNPSARLAEAVASSPRWRLRGETVEARILTTAYSAIEAELAPLLKTEPDCVLMIGVAGRSRMVRVERRATGRRSTLFADVSGRVATSPDEGGGGDDVRTTSQRVVERLLTLRAHRLPARVSRDAGRYLCNAAYFRALVHDRRTLFIHIPMTPSPTTPSSKRLSKVRTLGGADWDRRLRNALVEIAFAMTRDARRVAGPNGFR